MKRMWIIGVMLCMTVAASTLAPAPNAAEPNRGPGDMMLEGGSRGDVPFPHHRHQSTVDDECRTCHDVFPQKIGSIEALKAEGKLKPKYVMNKLCTGCHREKKRAGEPSGPTTCRDCHVR